MRGATLPQTLGYQLHTVFQSTLPMRGATLPDLSHHHVSVISIHTPHAGSDRPLLTLWQHCQNFNPHSPCGERPSWKLPYVFPFVISIHTPHAGSDFSHPTCKWSLGISIHTPHAGSDLSQRPAASLPRFISIHTPHAGSDCSGYYTG